MARTTNRGAARVIRAGVVIVGLSLTLVQALAVAQEAPSYTIQDFGVLPRPVFLIGLLRMEPVSSELGITDAQKKEQEAIVEGRFQKLQQARRDTKDMASGSRRSRRHCSRENDSATPRRSPACRALRARTPRPDPDPARRAPRLRQARDRVRVDGLYRNPSYRAARTGRRTGPAGARLHRRRGEGDREGGRLSDRPGLQEWAADRGGDPHAGREPGIPGGQAEGPPGGPRGHCRRDPAHRRRRSEAGTRAARGLPSATRHRSRPVHACYGGHRRTSARSTSAWWPRHSALAAAASVPIRTSIPRWPGRRLANEGTAPFAHPLFDEAHNNFHTAGGRYKPFAELIANDGYKVIPTADLSGRCSQKGGILCKGRQRRGQGRPRRGPGRRSSALHRRRV